MIYFDSTATTKPTKEIIELYNKISLEYKISVLFPLESN